MISSVGLLPRAPPGGTLGVPQLSLKEVVEYAPQAIKPPRSAQGRTL
jgi:hypothetical protein